MEGDQIAEECVRNRTLSRRLDCPEAAVNGSNRTRSLKGCRKRAIVPGRSRLGKKAEARKRSQTKRQAHHRASSWSCSDLRLSRRGQFDPYPPLAIFRPTDRFTL
jgi:hypothetical protein